MSDESEDPQERKQKGLGNFIEDIPVKEVSQAVSTTKRSSRAKKKKKNLQIEEQETRYALFTLGQIVSWTICPNIALQPIPNDTTFFQDSNLLDAYHKAKDDKITLLEHLTPLIYVKKANLPFLNLEKVKFPLIDGHLSFIYQNTLITGIIKYLNIDFQNKKLLSLVEWFPLRNGHHTEKRKLLETKLRFVLLGLQNYYQLDCTQAQVYLLSSQHCLEERKDSLEPEELLDILGPYLETFIWEKEGVTKLKQIFSHQIPLYLFEIIRERGIGTIGVPVLTAGMTITQYEDKIEFQINKPELKIIISKTGAVEKVTKCHVGSSTCFDCPSAVRTPVKILSDTETIFEEILKGLKKQTLVSVCPWEGKLECYRKELCLKKGIKGIKTEHN
ncbi:MAG: hypothetical protein ACFFCZ_22925 [Promethearchaeota archaeon]